jgi:LmbE family N-acetylglucosaminyl deacetylase
VPLHLYLAPHLDDAILSCGGLIARQLRSGDSALVLTVFAGDPPAGPLSALAEEVARRGQAAEDHVALRRAEDRAACERLGASWLHWEYPDCIYRRDPATSASLYPDVESIFGQIQPCERGALAGGLAIRLQALCDACRPTTVYAPLTAGHHVDHHLVQWAARRLSPRGWTLRFYEDYPYVAVPAFLEMVFEAGGRWLPEIEPLTPANLAAKIEAIACYRSQVPGLFRGEEPWPEVVKGYFHGLTTDGPAERYWRPARPHEAVP